MEVIELNGKKYKLVEEPIYEENKLEVGKWYKKTTESLIYCTGTEGNTIKGYGFDMHGNWRDNCAWGCNKKEFSPATNKEVEKALIKEAKKRGYKKNNFKCLNSNTLMGGDDIKPMWFKKEDGDSWEGIGLYCGNQYLFKKGKWAEIIKLNELPVINGYKGKLLYYAIEYGCAELPISWFHHNGNRSLESIKLTNGIKLGYEDIKQIKEYLNENGYNCN